MMEKYIKYSDAEHDTLSSKSFRSHICRLKL